MWIMRSTPNKNVGPANEQDLKRYIRASPIMCSAPTMTKDTIDAAFVSARQ